MPRDVEEVSRFQQAQLVALFASKPSQLEQRVKRPRIGVVHGTSTRQLFER